jgi:hypothetical protein
VVRKLCISTLFLALVPAAPATAAVAVFPGVTYAHVLRFTPRGPLSLYVIRGPRPVGLYSLGPVLSNGTLLGRQTVSSMERSVAAQTTSIGVNGDFFNWADGYPTGILMRNGVLDHQPHPRRSSLGVDAAGTLHVDRVSFSGAWQGTGPAHPIQLLNDPPRGAETGLFTPAWGDVTPPAQGTLEFVLANLPPIVPGTAVTGQVADVHPGGGTRIPPGGAVLVTRGRAANAAGVEADVGSPVKVTFALAPWSGIVGALGGGPLLVRDGHGAVDAREALSSAQLQGREPRTAVGQRADGGIAIVAADGRQRGSVGVTNWELAAELVRLGCVTGMALDSGGSTTVALDGTVLNRPSDTTGERPVSEALLLTYAGVYAPLPAASVVSPNGDGVDESQTLTYKVVRPSTVTAKLVAPDGTEQQLDAAARTPGRYSFRWKGGGAEGLWHWRVTAVDDEGRTTTADRTFRVDTTLGSLAARGGRDRVAVRFRLSRPARLVVTVLSRFGEPLRRVVVGGRAAGPGAVRFSSRDGRGRHLRGGYVVRVAATSSVGATEASVPLNVRY